ncbi:MAG: GNAT family N-acetyltransferase [Hyphomicrobiaceae bacterium]|nr:GNAT family N-acetyltransferase [Hyphomicrobiaceae bacterium]
MADPGFKLADGYTDLPAGYIAAIATSLEMRAPPPVRPAPAVPGLVIRRVERPETGWYRDLFRRIGEPWLWQSRLRLSPGALEATIRSPDVEIWALAEDGRDEGLLELDFRAARTCELAFFGLTMPLVGRGAGRMLMGHAIARAWRHPIDRFWLHTCTLDHPGALAFYMRSGFRPFHLQLELAPDPRLDGTLSPEAAPQVPIIRP